MAAPGTDSVPAGSGRTGGGRQRWQAAEPPILPPLSIVGRLRLAAEVIVTYAQARWHLSRSDLSSTAAVLRERDAADRSVPPGLASRWHAVRLAKAVLRVLDPLPIGSKCLMESLVLTAMLARRGIDSVLVVAVKSEPGFAAHAWVEHDQRPLLPGGEFERLVEI
jgi:hypothetical protein